VATTTEHPARPGYGRLIFHGLREAKRDHVTNVAAALAYYGFLAVPSALLVLLGVFTLVAQPSDVTQLLAHLKGVIPDSAISLLEDSLVRMTSTQQNGGLAMIIVGLLFALWTLTGAMTTLMWALNIAFDREESRGFVRQRLVALAMLFLVLLAAILAFVLLVLGPHLQGWVGDAIHQRTAVTWVWWIAEWPILLAAMLVAFVGVLYLGPSGTKSHRGLVSVGGLVTVVIWLVASGAFAFYASHFSSYNKSWGSLSAVIVMLTWIWLSALALLVGAEIEAAILRGGARAAATPATSRPEAAERPAEPQPNATSAA
jgi:membrane protein